MSAPPAATAWPDPTESKSSRPSPCPSLSGSSRQSIPQLSSSSPSPPNPQHRQSASIHPLESSISLSSTRRAPMESSSYRSSPSLFSSLSSSSSSLSLSEWPRPDLSSPSSSPEDPSRWFSSPPRSKLGGKLPGLHLGAEESPVEIDHIVVTDAVENARAGRAGEVQLEPSPGLGEEGDVVALVVHAYVLLLKSLKSVQLWPVHLGIRQYLVESVVQLLELLGILAVPKGMLDELRI
mmetsp:Transcript_25896/g.61592  ORF Transcript_25896/g.61592 Transcript_25896/m.61592 type:complete len:237 (+) Transcript_25896:322-1032(+)